MELELVVTVDVVVVLGHREREDSRSRQAAAVMELLPNDGRGLREANGMRKSEE